LRPAQKESDKERLEWVGDLAGEKTKVGQKVERKLRLVRRWLLRNAQQGSVRLGWYLCCYADPEETAGLALLVILGQGGIRRVSSSSRAACVCNAVVEQTSLVVDEG